nr:hypothetical protein [Tanacetum cinerariifolium]
MMTKITDLEASFEPYKVEQAASQAELKETMEKYKIDADKQFAEILQLLKTLQPVATAAATTLPATIPRFEENCGQIFNSDKVEKEGKDIGFIETEDNGTCIGVMELANRQDNKSPTWAGDQSRIREKDAPSYGLRKQHMGGQIFCAGLELTVGSYLGAFEGFNCDLGRGEERITWNPGINHHSSIKKWNSGLNSFTELIVRDLGCVQRCDNPGKLAYIV